VQKVLLAGLREELSEQRRVRPRRDGVQFDTIAGGHDGQLSQMAVRGISVTTAPGQEGIVLVTVEEESLPDRLRREVMAGAEAV